MDTFNSPKKRKTTEDELPPISALLASVDSYYLFPKKPTLHNSTNTTPTTISTLKIVNEPDTWQISNYNLQPVLTIELPENVDEAVIKAELVSDKILVEMGFQTASTQVVSANSKFFLLFFQLMSQ